MKIAIIDSGINAAHPHVRAIAGGIGVAPEGLNPRDFHPGGFNPGGVNPGDFNEDTRDRLGHGTAVAGVIREKVPHADLFAVKVFDRRLSTGIDVMVRALDWCRYHQMDLVNLSVELEDPDQRAALESAIAGLLVVSAARQLPGCLPGVIAVDADEECPRDEFRYRGGVFYASPYPRPAAGSAHPESPRGVGFAVANMTGFVARTLPSIRATRELAGRAWHDSITALRDNLVWELASIEERWKF